MHEQLREVKSIEISFFAMVFNSNPEKLSAFRKKGERYININLMIRKLGFITADEPHF